MLVFVQSNKGNPLMPCSWRKARLLLKSGKATIINKKYDSFTIKLLYSTPSYIQIVQVGVDTGAKFIGIAVRNGINILCTRQINLRTDVSSLLTTRRILRRSRRQRNTRYRKARFLNRAIPKGWLPPSINSRVNNVANQINNLLAKFPQTELIFEVGNFDPQKMNNPNIQGKEYQQGEMFGFNEVKAFVLARDKYQCQHKSHISKNPKLHVHHIIFRSLGGTNQPKNLITLCEDCHNKLHQCLVENTFKKPKLYLEPPFMNTLKCRFKEYFPNALFCYGYETKAKRQEMNIAKSHINDAIAISFYNNSNNSFTDYNNNQLVMQFRSKKRSLHESIPRKRIGGNTTSQRNNKNTTEVEGFKLGEQVVFENQLCHISGFTGKSAYLKDKTNNYLKLIGKNYKQISLSKLTKVCYNNNWIVYNL